MKIFAMWSTSCALIIHIQQPYDNTIITSKKKYNRKKIKMYAKTMAVLFSLHFHWNAQQSTPTNEWRKTKARSVLHLAGTIFRTKPVNSMSNLDLLAVWWSSFYDVISACVCVRFAEHLLMSRTMQIFPWNFFNYVYNTFWMVEAHHSGQNVYTDYRITNFTFACVHIHINQL